MTYDVYLDGRRIEDFAARIERKRASLRERGIKARELVAIQAEQPLEFLAFYEACIREDIVVVVLGQGARPLENVPTLGIAAVLHPDGEIRSTNVSARKAGDEVALVLQTSGTTGQPRFIVQSKEALRYQTEQMALRLGYREGDRLFVGIPPWSAYGLTLVHTAQRLPVSLAVSSARMPRTLVRALAESKATVCDGAPGWYLGLARHLAREPADIAALSLRLTCVGGDVLTPSVAQRWEAATKLPLLDGYGLSEAGGNVAIQGPDDRETGTVGHPYIGTELRFGEDGELFVRSPSVSPGCLTPEGLRPLSDADGWLSTGDLGELTPSGSLKIVGRKKNVVIVNGHNIVPENVEDVLRGVGDVRDCIVVGHRDTHGEKLVALVVAGASFDAEAARAACIAQLGTASVPARFFHLDEVPTSPNGKALRREATLRAAELLAAEREE